MIDLSTHLRLHNWLSRVVSMVILSFGIREAGAVQSILLAWDPSPSSDVVRYKLYYGNVAANLTNQIVFAVDLGEATGFHLENLKVDETYFAYVTAFNRSGLESKPSNLLTFSVNRAPSTLTGSDEDMPANMQTYTVVSEVNNAPVLAAIADQVVTQGNTLTFTAQAIDADLPVQTLTYSLDAGAPSGATIDPATGAFSWTPATNEAPGTNRVTIRVTDNGSLNLSDTRTFAIIVKTQPGLRLLSLVPLTDGYDGYVSVHWSSEPGQSYRIQWKTNLSDATWSDLAEVTTESETGQFLHQVGSAVQSFYRVQLVK